MTARLLVGSRGRLAAVPIGSVGAAGVGACSPPADHAGASSPATSRPTTTSVPPESGPVSYVFDGDTIEVREGAGTARARVLGINAPEIAHDSKPAQ